MMNVFAEMNFRVSPLAESNGESKASRDICDIPREAHQAQANLLVKHQPWARSLPGIGVFL